MSTVPWTNAKYLITAGPAVLVTASVMVEVTTPEDTAGVAEGGRHQDRAASKNLSMGQASPHGTFQHASTAMNSNFSCSHRKSCILMKKKPSSLGAEGLEVRPKMQWDMWPNCCHLLPKHFLPRDADGDRQHLEKGVTLSMSV